MGEEIQMTYWALCLQDTWSLHSCLGSLRDTEAPEVEKKGAYNQATSLLVVASHQYEPRSRRRHTLARSVRIKNVPLRHPKKALAALNNINVALVGQDPIAMLLRNYQ